MTDYDICIIGAGPGGIAAAIEASFNGAKVAIVEKDEIGGICLNKGCIPTKSYLRSASVYDELRRSGDFGVNAKDISYDFPRIKLRAQEIVSRLRQQARSSLKARDVDIIKGEVVFLNKRNVDVGGRKIGAQAFIIATGSSPKTMNGITADNKRIYYSEGILDIENMPEEITIVGAGPIGCEFASFFAAFGTRVSLIEILDRILPKEDKEISDRIEGIFKKKNINIHTGATSFDIETVKSGTVLISVGRSANIKGLGLDKAGVAVKDGNILVDEYLQTNINGIFAVGDCLGKYNLAHMASAQGRIAAVNALGGRIAMDYAVVPLCVYSAPEVASVGLSTEEAEKKGIETKINRLHFAAISRAHTQAETDGFIKLIADKKSDVVLGAHIIGYYASEIIGLVGVAIKGGLTTKELAETVQAHPTLSEGVQEAALGLYRQTK